ncbi:MAG: hypothetical protein Q8P58_00350 [Candidatus Adlerbacteria bacterium]|nr:hypothetical protein [Candidatus Adlerbacteria bacterium]
MAEDPNVPPKPAADSSPTQSGAGHVDLQKVLLPKKEVPGKTPESALRINAGILFEQEQKAGEGSGVPAPTKPLTPQTPPRNTTKPEETMIAPLQTYKGDIESLIQTTNASAVSIAAAEAARRAGAPLEAQTTTEPTNWNRLLKRTGMVVGGVVLLAAAGGALYFVYERLNATVSIPEATPAPFISVDATTPFALPPGAGAQRTTLVATLEAERQNNPLSLGLIERFAIFETTVGEEGNTYTPLGIESLLPVLAPNVPPELLRTLTGSYLLGIHTYDGTQAFLLLEVDSYERAFAAMLAWERAMRGDLLPLFDRSPRPRLPEEGVATSSVGDVPQLLQTGFADKILENRDTRVILNTSGDILLLWAPLTQNLFVITTNEYTLREIISRLGL